MAGLYVHIPFCKKRCLYCDFYSGTDIEKKKRYINALCSEWNLRRSELYGERIDTVYLGGGTPSQLDISELTDLFNLLSETVDLSHCSEITIEANPDDLSDEYISGLVSLPVNRISIGIQSFDDADLKFLNRRHTALQAVEAVQKCKYAGFDNISIDLIYGLPGQTLESWEKNIRKAAGLHISHISAYNLIYEEGTPLHRLLLDGKVEECDEELALQMFDLLIDTLGDAGYEHYEISNFALPGCYSRHNTAYWKDIPYLGLGASAHSYDNNIRRWNIADTHLYCGHIESGKVAYEVENLSFNDRYNDLILTSLRTIWGLDLDRFRNLYGEQRYAYCLQQASPYIQSGCISLSARRMCLTRKGLFISDRIMSDLLFVE